MSMYTWVPHSVFRKSWLDKMLNDYYSLKNKFEEVGVTRKDIEDIAKFNKIIT